MTARLNLLSYRRNLRRRSTSKSDGTGGRVALRGPRYRIDPRAPPQVVHGSPHAALLRSV